MQHSIQMMGVSGINSLLQKTTVPLLTFEKMPSLVHFAISFSSASSGSRGISACN